MKIPLRIIAAGAIVVSLVLGAPNVKAQKPTDQGSGREIDTVTIDTNLVTVPVIASSRTGGYIGDLQKGEFNLLEDGVAQEIAFFGTVRTPFDVALLLDTSDSTQEKLGQIQQAAISFLNQLGASDRVKVISFDGELHDWNDFTSDKQILRNVIQQTRSGHDTRVYDAIQLALDALRPIKQRKAIVVFTDGMDWHSESSSYESTIHDLDESGVIVYPIRFETRAETERLARKQQEETEGTQLPTSDIIKQAPNGTTPTTFPSDESFPTRGTTRGPLPVPPPSVIFGPRRTPTQPDPRDEPVPTAGGGMPGSVTPRPAPARPRNDSIGAMLDVLYLKADSYLKDLADRSGGQLYRADTVTNLPQAFAAIAAELRTQYLLGYYPKNQERDGSYRKIQVKTTRKDVALRARPGYRARSVE